MGVKFQRTSKVITAILVFAVTQISLAGSLATGNAPKMIAPDEPTGILSTSGNKPITVNGASAATGATIVSGAIIETPDNVTATITIPGRGTIEISPKTQLSIQIDQAGNIVVKVRGGCAFLRTTKGTTGKIENSHGVVGKSDGSAEAVMSGCPPDPLFPSGENDLNPAIPIGIIGASEGTGLYFAFADHGNNPSPAGL
jgi:hypothetical protein